MKKLIALWLGAMPALVFAQPANDNPCSAPYLTVNYSATLSCVPNTNGLTFSGATTSTIDTPPCGAGAAINDIWYVVSPSTSGTMTVRASSSGDGAMAVYEGKYGCSFFEAAIACNDDTLASSNPTCTFSVSGGGFYFIRFWIKGASSGTLNGLCVVIDAPSINPSQRVGIGLSNPQSTLDINGSLQIRGGSPGIGKVLTSDGQGKASWKTPNDNLSIPLTLNGSINNNYILSVANDNKLGTAIYARLGSSGYGYNYPQSAVWADADSSDGVHATSKEGIGLVAESRSANEYALVVQNSSTSTTPRAARFLGDVYIGEGGSGYMWGGNLTVRGDIKNVYGTVDANLLRLSGATSIISAVNFNNLTGSKINFWGTLSSSHYGIGIQSSALQIHTDVVGSDVVFGYGGSTNLTETARIKGNGNVGFGTSSPTRKMEVITSSGQSVLTVGSRSGFGSGALEFVSDYGTASQWRPGFIQSEDLGSFTGRLSFYTNGTGGANAYGIVKGMEIRNGVTYTASGTVSSFSDLRLKKNIEPFTDGLNVIEQIKPVRFQYLPNAPFPTDQTQVGVIAQDLEQIAPYMVQRENSADLPDLRSVNNQAYIFLLINAVKEQQQQINALKQEIRSLKKHQ